MTLTSSSIPSTERVLKGLSNLQYKVGQLNQYLEALATEIHALVDVDCVVISEVVNGVKATLMQKSLESLSADIRDASCDADGTGLDGNDIDNGQVSKPPKFRYYHELQLRSSAGKVLGAIDVYRS